MSLKVQCDVCGNTCKIVDATDVSINTLDINYKRNKEIASIDICPSCYTKLKEVLKIDK